MGWRLSRLVTRRVRAVSDTNDMPDRTESWFQQLGREYNIFHLILLIYSIPVVLLFLAMALGVVALALSDPGFAQLVLLTVIMGLIIGLPQALR